MLDPAIKLVTPYGSSEGRPFYRLRGVSLPSARRGINIDVAQYAEPDFRVFGTRERLFERSDECHIPSLAEYHGVLAFLFCHRKGGNVVGQRVEKLRRSLIEGEFTYPGSAGKHFHTSTAVFFTEQGPVVVHNYKQQDQSTPVPLPYFVNDYLGDDQTHAAALEALLGDGDAVRVGEIWEWASGGRKLDLLFGVSIGSGEESDWVTKPFGRSGDERRVDWAFPVCIGGTYLGPVQSTKGRYEAGIEIGTRLNVASRARAFRRDLLS